MNHSPRNGPSRPESDGPGRTATNDREALSIGAAGSGTGTGTTYAGTSDAGTLDAGTRDVGTSDTGTSDAGTLDVGKVAQDGQGARNGQVSPPTISAPVPLLKVCNLTKRFRIGSRFSAQGVRTVQAVDDVSLSVFPGETLGLVGESGCGKSTLGRCMARLYDISGGSIVFDGIDISHLNTRQIRPLRQKLQMVFQDPSASLNPRRRVRDLIAEPLRIHRTLSEVQIADRVAQLLDQVGLLPDHAGRYPHEFSGGQRQRIGIARAIALEPKLIILDEPVSALDVSVQAQIVNLLADLQDRLALTYVFVAHDLSVVRQVSTRIAVMYLGSVVEIGTAEDLFVHPAHPYTQALISAVPHPVHAGAVARTRIVLSGDVPSPLNPPSGCRFHPRCPVVQDRCRSERPPLVRIGPARDAACHFPLALADSPPTLTL